DLLYWLGWAELWRGNRGAAEGGWRAGGARADPLLWFPDLRMAEPRPPPEREPPRPRGPLRGAARPGFGRPRPPPGRGRPRVLRGNPARDPHTRIVPVYLPPSYDQAPARRYPVAFVLSGFTGRGRTLLNDNPWSPSLPERMDALLARGACGEMILVMPDCFTR